jgi:transcriptional regulator with XRE-family HTH domain
MPRINGKNSQVDLQVGAKIKMRRLAMGMSQEELANMIGITFQQVQKYEKGTNRVSVSRLVDISKALKVTNDFFLETSLGSKPGTRNLGMKGFSDTKQESIENLTSPQQRDALELLRAYSKIKNPQLKKQILEMAKAMSSEGKTS